MGVWIIYIYVCVCVRGGGGGDLVMEWLVGGMCVYMSL